MFQAQLLMCTASSIVYSPWFPRQGDNMVGTVELVASSGSTANITVTVLTRASDNTGNGTATGSTFGSSGGTAGRYSGTITAANGINEMVRYKFDPGVVSSGWVLFRMLAPVWFDSIV